MNRKVVCMVRGGEAGRDVQLRAIAYAQSHQLDLVFIHVINIDHYKFENETLKAPAYDELTWLARVILSLARRRALDAGLRAETVILRGGVLEQMQLFLDKTPVACVFIGAPFRRAHDLEQRWARVKSFAEQLTALTGVKVILTDAGSDSV